ncbi:hypothetical protein T492DRAFT_854218 [Pavlovales sp. CCMP2436]|nr:hypothetical protein T492DRAFT_854218 [Pavlovales sp. CCMP2436]
MPIAHAALLVAHAELGPAAAVVVIPDSGSAVALHRVLGLGDAERAAAAAEAASVPSGGAALVRARSQRAKLSAAFARRLAVPTVVTTESAARGLDLKKSVDSYVHVAGRTGREGRKGTVITVVPLGMRGVLDELRRELGVTIEEVDMTKMKQ